MNEKIKKWYTLGLWSANMVRLAEEKGCLSRQQVKEILQEEA